MARSNSSGRLEARSRSGVFRRGIRTVIGLGVLALACVTLWHALLGEYGRAWRHAPEDARWVLPDSARARIAAALAGSGGQPVSDDRVMMLSRGQISGAGFINHSHDHDKTALPPLAWLASRLRRAAAGIDDDSRADGEYLSRLLRQMQAIHGGYRADILARDGVFRADGTRDVQASQTVVDNAYVLWLASQAPTHLVPVVSVHPNRRDAAARLEHLASQGVHDISWLPVAQHIDLTGAAARALYPIMASAKMTLHLPIGWQAAHGDTAGRSDGWVDPRMLEPALDAGVHVELSLAGPTGRAGQQLMPRLWHLLAEPTHAGLVTVDLAGVLAHDRLASELLPLLQHPQFYLQLRYASGYPDSAVPGQVDLDGLVTGGFLPVALVPDLRAIYDVNPLLFTFVVMRNVGLPHTGLRLPAAVFFAPSTEVSQGT